MQTVRFSPIPMPEAEEVLADIWSRLEEYGIETPGIKVVSCSGGMVTLQFSFGCAKAAALALGRTEFSLDENVLAAQPKVPIEGNHRSR